MLAAYRALNDVRKSKIIIAITDIIMMHIVPTYLLQ